MKKKADSIVEGDTITIGGEPVKVVQVENSDMGKQGSKKTRIVAEKQDGEKITLIRPSDYPIEVK